VCVDSLLVDVCGLEHLVADQGGQLLRADVVDVGVDFRGGGEPVTLQVILWLYVLMSE
jgi:hypothetical protein